MKRTVVKAEKSELSTYRTMCREIVADVLKKCKKKNDFETYAALKKAQPKKYLPGKKLDLNWVHAVEDLWDCKPKRASRKDLPGQMVMFQESKGGAK